MKKSSEEKKFIPNGKQKEMKSIFAKRLKELRDENKLSHETLRDNLKMKCNITISKQALMIYEVTNEYQSTYDKGFGMNFTYLYGIAEYFGVSTDYLLGLSDIRKKDNEHIAASDLGLDEKAIETLKNIRFTMQDEYMPVLNLLIGNIRERYPDSSYRAVLDYINLFFKFSGISGVRIDKEQKDAHVLTINKQGIVSPLAENQHILPTSTMQIHSDTLEATYLRQVEGSLVELKKNLGKRDTQNGNKK
jgi:transcriptional regulator with XRE-family HTH domain